MRIVAAANLEVPAYWEIVRRGFEVKRNSKPNGTETWIAQRGPDSFEAGSPVQLLGTVAVREGRGDDWQASDGEIEAFIHAFYP